MVEDPLLLKIACEGKAHQPKIKYRTSRVKFQKKKNESENETLPRDVRNMH
jgi:hypothetical protein